MEYILSTYLQFVSGAPSAHTWCRKDVAYNRVPQRGKYGDVDDRQKMFSYIVNLRIKFHQTTLLGFSETANNLVPETHWARVRCAQHSRFWRLIREVCTTVREGSGIKCVLRWFRMGFSLSWNSHIIDSQYQSEQCPETQGLCFLTGMAS